MTELYIKYQEDKPIAYAFWCPKCEYHAIALYMDDIGYSTPEEAKAAWETFKCEPILVKPGDPIDIQVPQLKPIFIVDFPVYKTLAKYEVVVTEKGWTVTEVK